MAEVYVRTCIDTDLPFCLYLTLSDCSLASLSSAVSAANLAWLEAVICCSLASLSSAVSSASLSVIRCSLACLTSSVSPASLRLLCCTSASLLSAVWAACLVLSLILRFLNLSSLCSGFSEAWQALSRYLLWRSLFSLCTAWFSSSLWGSSLHFCSRGKASKQMTIQSFCHVFNAVCTYV